MDVMGTDVMDYGFQSKKACFSLCEPNKQNKNNDLKKKKIEITASRLQHVCPCLYLVYTSEEDAKQGFFFCSLSLSGSKRGGGEGLRYFFAQFIKKNTK